MGHPVYHSKRWRRVRMQVLHGAGWKCSKCDRRGSLECHHKIPLAKGGAAFDPDNLEAVCRSCHLRLTADQNTSPRTRIWRDYLNREAARIESEQC